MGLLQIYLKTVKNWFCVDVIAFSQAQKSNTYNHIYIYEVNEVTALAVRDSDDEQILAVEHAKLSRR